MTETIETLTHLDAGKIPVVFVPMCADFIHVGHINILDGAAKLGSVIVLLMTDEAMQTYKRAPKMLYPQREHILRSLRMVNDVIPCSGPGAYASMARAFKPDFFYHGDDWKTGPQAQGRLDVMTELTNYGGKLVEPPYTQTVSSTHFQRLFESSIDESIHTGVLVRGALNDLKRSSQAAAQEIGISVDILDTIIAGKDYHRENLDSVVTLLHNTYPIAMKHMVVDKDDSVKGVWYCSRKDTVRSGRVMERTNGYGDTVNYYNYMDTAVSRLSPFKPELIEMRVHVANSDPHDPLVVMNKGHLLAQLTFFIGPVNFYTTIRGERHCVEMKTGSSCLITPFVPHSFASRDPEQYAAIVAVTFSGKVKDIVADLMHLSMIDVLDAAGNRREAASVFMQKLERFSELRGLTPNEVKSSLLSKGYSAEAIEGTMTHAEVDPAMIKDIAEMLSVPEAELQVLQLEKDDEVTYAFPPSGLLPVHGACVDQKLPLASCKHHPDCGGFSWYLSGTSTLKSQFFQYIYNYGEVPLAMAWNGQKQVLYAGDSVVVKPFTSVTFTSYEVCGTHPTATVVVCKVAGCLSNAVMQELSCFAQEGTKSLATNTHLWF